MNGITKQRYAVGEESSCKGPVPHPPGSSTDSPTSASQLLPAAIGADTAPHPSFGCETSCSITSIIPLLKYHVHLKMF